MSDFADKVRSLGVIGSRTRPRVREWSDATGRHKATTDELGHTVTEHARPGHTEDRQDVTIRPPQLALRAALTEER